MAGQRTVSEKNRDKSAAFEQSRGSDVTLLSARSAAGDTNYHASQAEPTHSSDGLDYECKIDHCELDNNQCAATSSITNAQGVHIFRTDGPNAVETAPDAMDCSPVLDAANANSPIASLPDDTQENGDSTNSPDAVLPHAVDCHVNDDSNNIPDAALLPFESKTTQDSDEVQMSLLLTPTARCAVDIAGIPVQSAHLPMSMATGDHLMRQQIGSWPEAVATPPTSRSDSSGSAPRRTPPLYFSGEFDQADEFVGERDRLDRQEPRGLDQDFREQVQFTPGKCLEEERNVQELPVMQRNMQETLEQGQVGHRQDQPTAGAVSVADQFGREEKEEASVRHVTEVFVDDC